MSLFSDPVTVVTDRTFNAVNQTSDNKSIIYTWKELSAPLADNSRLLVKQSRSRVIINALLKRSQYVTLDPVPASGNLTAPCDWNLTYAGDSRITETQAQTELDILLALAQQTNFVRNLLAGLG